MKRVVSILSAIVILLAGLVGFGTLQPAHAVSADIGISNPGTQNTGAQFTVNYSITASDNMACQLTVSVQNGTIVGGTGSLYYDECATNSVGASVVIQSTNEEAVVVTVSGYCVGITDASRADVAKQTVIPIKTSSQIQAEQEAAAAAAAAAASQQAAEQAAAASQAAVNASIAAEQQKIQDSVAASEAEEASKIAESASIEESIKESEIASSEEESRSEAESLAEKESIEASIEASKAEAEATRAFELGSYYYVPYEYRRINRGKFLFAVKDTPIEAPEGYEETSLVLNNQDVKAFRNATMGEDLYVVYGRFEKDTEDHFYFYHAKLDQFLSYSDVTGDMKEAIPVETESEPVQTDKPAGTVSVRTLVAACIGSFLLGAAVAALVIFLILRNRKDDDDDDDIDGDGWNREEDEELTEEERSDFSEDGTAEAAEKEVVSSFEDEDFFGNAPYEEKVSSDTADFVPEPIAPVKEEPAPEPEKVPTTEEIYDNLFSDSDAGDREIVEKFE